MAKTIIIKLIKASKKAGPFNITDQFGHVIASNVPKSVLINGYTYVVDDNVAIIKLTSVGDCTTSKTRDIKTIDPLQLRKAKYIEALTACLWRHLTSMKTFNTFYGVVNPYIIEYSFAYQYRDEILQNVKDYTKAFVYKPDNTGVFVPSNKIEVDNLWFNKAVVYNGQQSSGILELVPKPLHNLKEYMKYPIYKSSSKVITYTKSDNFYQYNTFWSLVKNKSIPLFLGSCESLSIDKTVNQLNMDYSTRSFKKETLRAKDLKIRHILDNRDDVHLVSQFITNGTMISYK